MTETDATRKRPWDRGDILKVAAILLLSLLVRGGTGYFLASHLDYAGWFQLGSYKIFHDRTEDILNGGEPVFFISDPTRTDLIQYPPAFPLYMAAIYAS